MPIHGDISMSGRILPFISVSLVLFIFPPAAGSPKVDPATGAIRLLFIGDAFMAPGFPTPFFVDDPRMVVTPIPSEIAILGGDKKGTDLALRYYRMYLPRTKDKLLNYDEVIIADAQSHHLKHTFHTWVRDAVIEGGLGFLMADGPASFGGVEGAWGDSPSWGPTPVGEILPVECATDRKGWGGDTFQMVPEDPEHPLFKGKPSKRLFLTAHNRVYERVGGDVIARMSDNPPGSPLIATWDTGKGRSVVLVYDWGGNGVTDFYRWDYCSDFLIHLVYFPARLPIPEDLELDHLLRQSLTNYRGRRLYVISVIEFAEKFGASSKRLYENLREIDADKTSADILYRQLELQECYEAMNEIMERISELGEEAIKTKDRALFWIYVVEWCTVMATAMIAGSILYVLMIDRRVYRGVEVTRAQIR